MDLGWLPPADWGFYDSPGKKAQEAIHDQTEVHLKGNVAGRKRQKGHEQEVGCVAGKNSRQRLHEIGRHF